MKVYPILIIFLFRIPVLAQSTGIVPGVSAIHYPSQCLNLNAVGSALQFPACGLDSAQLCVLLNNQFNAFDPSIQNQSMAILGNVKPFGYKIGMAQFGNNLYQQQSMLMGLQLKLFDKVKMGAEFQFARSAILGYQTYNMIGVAIGFAIPLNSYLFYLNKIGFHLNQTQEIKTPASLAYNHVLFVRPISTFAVYGNYLKTVELQHAMFSLGCQLQLNQTLSSSMNFRPEQQQLTLGLEFRLKKTQLVIETKLSQAIGVGYFLALSKYFAQNERKTIR